MQNLFRTSLASSAIIAGFALSVLAVEGTINPVHAVSADCSTLAINQNLANGAFSSTTYTFEAGETITFTLTVPAGATIQISFLGQSQSLSANGTLTFVVPNTGPTATGSFLFSISGLAAGQTVGISGTCAGVTGGGGGGVNVDGNTASNVLDDAIGSALPGGLSGDLSGAFGADPSLSEAFFDFLFLREFQAAEARVRALEEDVNELDEKINELSDELFGPGDPTGDRVREAEQALKKALDKRAVEFDGLRLGIGDADEAREAVQAVENARLALEQARVEDLRRSQENSDILAGNTELQDLLGQRGDLQQELQEARDKEKAASERAFANAGRALVRDNQRAQERLDSRAFGPTEFFENRSPSAHASIPSPLAASGSGISGRFDLHTWRRAKASDEDQDLQFSSQDVIATRWNAWVQGSVTFHDVNSSNRSEDGHTAAVAGGVSYRLAPRWVVGLAGRYASSDRDGQVADTELDVWSVAAFLNGLLPGNVVVNGIASASFGTGDTVLDPSGVRGRGTFDFEAYQAQLTASRRYVRRNVWAEPSVSATLSHVSRDGFTDSNGTVVPGSNSTRLTGAAGLTTGINLPFGSDAVLTPQLGVRVFASAIDDPDRVTPVDRIDSSIGANLNGGLDLLFSNGALLTVNSGATFTEDAVDTTFSGRIRIPFGG